MINVLQNLIDGVDMTEVTISPKYQVVIPREVREKLGLKPGQKIQVTAREGRIEMIPVIPASELRGFVQGMDTNIDREDDRF